MSGTIAFLVLLGLTGVIGAPNRIVGGSQASLGQFPHQISLQVGGNHICGGSIVTPTKILTAAHCVYGNNRAMQVVAGILDLGSGGQRVDVDKASYHSGYDPAKTLNDVAVLILRTPLTYNNYVRPIVLSTAAPAPGATLTLSGWGLTSYPGSPATRLQFINLQNIDLQTCATQLAGIPNPITTGHVCTSSPAGKGACQGDSGGPLIGSNGQQVGIVSWGVPCARGRPDVFTGVAFYYNWIITTN